MTTIEITLIVTVILFALLVLYAIKLLSTSCQLFERAIRTLDAVKKQLEDLDHEPKNLLRHTNELTADLTHKMKKLNPFFDALHNMGQSLECKTSSHHTPCSCSYCRSKMLCNQENTSNSLSSFVHLAKAGAKIWEEYQEYKKGR